MQRIWVADVEFEVWVAETVEQQRRGLMFATAAQIAPLADGTPRGMLFVFPSPQVVAFTMRDTPAALDLAFIGAEGAIIETRSLVPLDPTPVPSPGPVAFGLEVAAGTLAAFAIEPGDVLTLPSPGPWSPRACPRRARSGYPPRVTREGAMRIGGRGSFHRAPQRARTSS